MQLTPLSVEKLDYFTNAPHPNKNQAAGNDVKDETNKSKRQIHMFLNALHAGHRILLCVLKHDDDISWY